MSIPNGHTTEGIGISRLGQVAVTLAEDANEERLDAVDPLPVVFPGIGGFAVGISTSSFDIRNSSFRPVHIEELQPQLLDALAQPCPDLLSRKIVAW
jgi:hypothetical protein